MNAPVNDGDWDVADAYEEWLEALQDAVEGFDPSVDATLMSQPAPENIMQDWEPMVSLDGIPC